MLGGGNPVGATFSGTGAGIQYLGNKKYGGWSGSVTATNGTNGTLFSFTTPDQPIFFTMVFAFDELNLSDGARVGFIINLDGQVIFQSVPRIGQLMPMMDFDPIPFAIPGEGIVTIECTTTDGQDIAFTAMLTGEEV